MTDNDNDNDNYIAYGSGWRPDEADENQTAARQSAVASYDNSERGSGGGCIITLVLLIVAAVCLFGPIIYAITMLEK